MRRDRGGDDLVQRGSLDVGDGHGLDSCNDRRGAIDRARTVA
jgi:hypothetical protein